MDVPSPAGDRRQDLVDAALEHYGDAMRTSAFENELYTGIPESLRALRDRDFGPRRHV
jgi:hypothetical protein